MKLIEILNELPENLELRDHSAIGTRFVSVAKLKTRKAVQVDPYEYLLFRKGDRVTISSKQFPVFSGADQGGQSQWLR